MAISIDTKIQRVEVYPGIENEEGVMQSPTLMVVLEVTTDDPKDDMLPITATSVKHLKEGDDISGLPQLVSDITSGIWNNTQTETEDNE